jgi:hypothetical protein
MNSAEQCLIEIVRSRDVSAPITSLAWHWWACRHGRILPEDWMATCRASAPDYRYAGVAFVSLSALAERRSMRPSQLSLEMVPTPVQLRRKLFESDLEQLVATLHNLINVALVTTYERASLASAGRPTSDTYGPVGLARFAACGIFLQDLRHSAAILAAKQGQRRPGKTAWTPLVSAFE